MARPEASRPGQTGRTELDARARATPDTGSGPDHFAPEPEDNQPGHHPAEEQDQPPLDDFAARFGISGQDPSGGEGGPAEPPPDVESPSGPDRPADRAAAASHALPDPVRQVWAVTVRHGVLPILGGVRAVADVLERAARDSIR